MFKISTKILEIAKKGIASADPRAQCKDDRKSGSCEHEKKNGQGKENLGTVCYVRIKHTSNEQFCLVGRQIVHRTIPV